MTNESIKRGFLAAIPFIVILVLNVFYVFFVFAFIKCDRCIADCKPLLFKNVLPAASAPILLKHDDHSLMDEKNAPIQAKRYSGCSAPLK